MACITYTNRSKDNIESKIKFNPIVLVNTIHSFFWSVIQPFQKELKHYVINSPDWRKRWDSKYATFNDSNFPSSWSIENIKDYSIQYTIMANRIVDPKNKLIILHHDDIISFSTLLLKREKFRIILRSAYPFILIDEYQDTNKYLVEALISEIENNNISPTIGFYGDSWQKIYDDGIGEIKSSYITKIDKQSNFRSNGLIINVLNNIRPDLGQFGNNNRSGIINIFHTNNFNGKRRDGTGGGHWTNDLPEQEATNALEMIKEKLNWNFDDTENTKILLLTNNIISKYGSYHNLLKCFKYPDDLLKKNNKFINFFSSVLEPVCLAYQNKRYGEMFAIQDNYFTPPMKSNRDKEKLNNYLQLLLESREKTIFDVIDTLINQPVPFPKLPDELEQTHILIKSQLDLNETELSTNQKTYKNMSVINYQEVINALNYIDNLTPFSTQHGVKGEEYENVLIVLGRGWNKYNWDNFLIWSRTNNVPIDKQDIYEKNRNLFYVSCSRAKTNLSLLFTQELSSNALYQLAEFFGENNIQDLYK
ncbi:ATP-dependent helicase [Photorhabdus noenieputensis]|uniref:UvrD-helicase domain-containing protein n=1 Tax=Photorhabdus noenieputensis TaxID=1208607 RepID=UPI001BD32D8A|nr:ATP-dependent helicase [Photorhabdus noenieputensis]